MTWSANFTDKPALEALTLVAENTQLPESIRGYLTQAVASLAECYGKDVPVTISATGHLFTGERGNYDLTNASIIVKRGVEVAVEKAET